MGTYDISRINFNPLQHYKSVRMQQGRVLTDDDWNESERIGKENERRSLQDVIGAFGTPDNGFMISPVVANGALVIDGSIDFNIAPGTLYLGGLRLELESPETYRQQKDWLSQPINIDPAPVFDSAERYDLVYIEAWQQPVCAVEDAALFEAALGGPDTTTRVKNMRRVRIEPLIGTCSCVDAWETLISRWQVAELGNTENYERKVNAHLKVSYSNDDLPKDLCTPAATGSYLGAENQAIRVQVIDKTHFTWGFDNASPLYRVIVTGGNTVELSTEPKDQYHWPVSGQLIELLSWSAVLSNGEKVAEMSGHLSKVQNSYDPDSGKFTFQADILNPVVTGEYYLRIWNRGSDLSSEVKLLITTAPIKLGNTGLAISFTGNELVANDFWVIAARPETPNKVVPWELEQGTGISPHGNRRFFAPLAIIQWTSVAGQVPSGKIISDCRKKFHPLTEQECCCTYTVGDGKHSKGDFNSIQDAINNLPANGGKICVLPGDHMANVIIDGKRQIRITGCGDQSIVRPISKDENDASNLSKPVFLIRNSQRIQIDQLTIAAFDGIGIELADIASAKLMSEQITINENRILAGIHAVNVYMREDKGGDNHIHISNNQIGMLDKAIGKPAIFSIADNVLIERNRIVVIPATDGTDPDDPTEPGDPNDKDPLDPCVNKAKINRIGVPRFKVFSYLRYVKLYRSTGRSAKQYLAMGGIQIGGTSERVRILENEIIGGKGNGITLGHMQQKQVPGTASLMAVVNKKGYAPLYEINIEGNKIMQMGLSGISTQLNFSTNLFYVYIKDLVVYRNHIANCVRQLPQEAKTDIFTHAAFGGITLSFCDGARIEENTIEKNGLIANIPVCGVYILYGEEINISTNNILHNGLAATEDKSVRPGFRGGIVVRMSFKKPGIENLFAPQIPSFDGVPSVKVHDNIVVQPLGHALFLIAFGPLSVVSNQFSSFGVDAKNIVSKIASAVMVFNLGVSKDLVMLGFRNMANKNPAEYKKHLTDPSYQKVFRALQYLPNGKVMFSDNQVTLDLRSTSRTTCLSSLFIGSLDDVSFISNQSECAGFTGFADKNILTFDIVFFDTVLFAFSARSNDNRFTDGMIIAIYSLLSYAYMNTAIGNQSTHCLHALGALRAITHNLVLDEDADHPCNTKKALLVKAMAVPVGKDAK